MAALLWVRLRSALHGLLLARLAGLPWPCAHWTLLVHAATLLHLLTPLLRPALLPAALRPPLPLPRWRPLARLLSVRRSPPAALHPHLSGSFRSTSAGWTGGRHAAPEAAAGGGGLWGAGERARMRFWTLQFVLGSAMQQLALNALAPTAKAAAAAPRLEAGGGWTAAQHHEHVLVLFLTSLLVMSALWPLLRLGLRAFKLGVATRIATFVALVSRTQHPGAARGPAVG